MVQYELINLTFSIICCKLEKKLNRVKHLFSSKLSGKKGADERKMRERTQKHKL